MVHFKDTRRQRTSLSVSYLVVSFLSGFPENHDRCLLSGFCPCFLSGVCLSRFCRLSGFRPDMCKKDCPISICPDVRSPFCPLSGFCLDISKKTVRCLSVPPAGQGPYRTVRSPDFRRSSPPTSDGHEYKVRSSSFSEKFGDCIF